jgi:uncharacterized protein (TIGR02145 family)
MKKITLFIVLNLLSLTSFCQCISGDCVNGYGKYLYPNGDIHEGNFVNGYANGYGKHTWSYTGDTDEGEWKDNVLTGWGKQITEDGRIFEGYFENSSMIITKEDYTIKEQLIYLDTIHDVNSRISIIKGVINTSENPDLYLLAQSKLNAYLSTTLILEASEDNILFALNLNKESSLQVVKGIDANSNSENKEDFKIDSYVYFLCQLRLDNKLTALNQEIVDAVLRTFTIDEYPNKDVFNLLIESKKNTAPQITSTTNKSNSYSNVTIGEQVWMTANLSVSTFRNGDTIPEARTSDEFASACLNEKPAWCYYKFNSQNGATFGKLYNWYAVIDPRGLAPEGWHIPSNSEWELLKGFTGKALKSKSGWPNVKNDGTAFKACSNCVDWNSEYRKKVACHICKDKRYVTYSVPIVEKSTNGDNSSGLNMTPGGGLVWRGNGTTFNDLGNSGFWWTSSEYTKSYAHIVQMADIMNSLIYDETFKSSGLSIRCVKD